MNEEVSGLSEGYVMVIFRLQEHELSSNNVSPEIGLIKAYKPEQAIRRSRPGISTDLSESTPPP